MVIYNLPNDFNLAEEQDKPVIIRSHQSTIFVEMCHKFLKTCA